MPRHKLITAFGAPTGFQPDGGVTAVIRVEDSYINIDFSDPEDPDTSYGSVAVGLVGGDLEAFVKPTRERPQTVILHGFGG